MKFNKIMKLMLTLLIGISSIAVGKGAGGGHGGGGFGGGHGGGGGLGGGHIGGGGFAGGGHGFSGGRSFGGGGSFGRSSGFSGSRGFAGTTGYRGATGIGHSVGYSSTARTSGAYTKMPTGTHVTGTHITGTHIGKPVGTHVTGTRVTGSHVGKPVTGTRATGTRVSGTRVAGTRVAGTHVGKATTGRTLGKQTGFKQAGVGKGSHTQAMNKSGLTKQNATKSHLTNAQKVAKGNFAHNPKLAGLNKHNAHNLLAKHGWNHWHNGAWGWNPLWWGLGFGLLPFAWSWGWNWWWGNGIWWWGGYPWYWWYDYDPVYFEDVVYPQYVAQYEGVSGDQSPNYWDITNATSDTITVNAEAGETGVDIAQGETKRIFLDIGNNKFTVDSASGTMEFDTPATKVNVRESVKSMRTGRAIETEETVSAPVEVEV